MSSRVRPPPSAPAVAVTLELPEGGATGQAGPGAEAGAGPGTMFHWAESPAFIASGAHTPPATARCGGTAPVPASTRW
jgi:hypothetical protein